MVKEEMEEIGELNWGQCTAGVGVGVMAGARKVGCSIPITWMEFGQGRPRTGCLMSMTPSLSIQNLGSEKFQEGVRRGLIICSDLKKTESQTWGENAVKKNRVPIFL